MYKKYKFNYANINKSVFDTELNKKCAYYGNVVMWTTMFALPLYFLLDYLFLSEGWLDLIFFRLIGFGLSYLVYTLHKKNHWGFEKTITWFIAINVGIQAIICGMVPSMHAFPYFIMLAIYILIVYNTVLWNPMHSVYIFLFSLIIILLFYAFKNRPDKYLTMIESGGGIYVALALIACFLAFTRFNSLCKEVENQVVNGKIELPPKQISSMEFPHSVASNKKEEISTEAVLEEKIIKPFVEEKSEQFVAPIEEKISMPIVAWETPQIVEEKTEQFVAPIEEKISTPIVEWQTPQIVDSVEEKFVGEIENIVSDNKEIIPTVIAEAVEPEIAAIVDDKKEELSELIVETAPKEKPKKSIHEEIEDTIRLLRGEKPKEEFSDVQNFVSSTIVQPEAKELMELEAPQVRDEVQNVDENEVKFVDSAKNEDIIVAQKEEQIAEQVEAIVPAPINKVEEIKVDTGAILDDNLVTSNLQENISINKEKVNLNEVVETTVIDLIDTIHLKDQSIQLNISPAANNVFQEKNKIEEAVHIIIQHILRYSPSSSIITCNADKINEKAVLEITSHSAVDSGEKLKEIAENYKTQGTQATNLANDVGLGNIKVEIEKIGGSFYYNLTNDNSNYLKLELPSTQ
ncbi:MAG: hypothetical protein ACOVMI_05100 [Chitinophagaceae bacterium]